MEKHKAAQATEAKGWQEYLAPSSSAGSGGTEKEKEKEGEKEKKKKKEKFPKLEKLDCSNVKPWLPDVPGVTVWYEWQSGRVRAAYTSCGTKVTRSKSVEVHGEAWCVLWALHWTWAEHTGATGVLPHFELPALPPAPDKKDKKD